MSTKIYASTGAREYVGGIITETAGKDISSATFVVGVSSSLADPPTVWVTPDVSTAGATPAQRIVKLLVSSTTPVGTYWCWVKITDNPEIKPMRLQGPITVI